MWSCYVTGLKFELSKMKMFRDCCAAFCLQLTILYCELKNLRRKISSYVFLQQLKKGFEVEF